MDKKFSGNQWFTVNNNTKPVYEDPVEQNNNVAFNKQPIEELSEDPEALEARLIQMIEDLEPARDVREAYMDCVRGGCDMYRINVFLNTAEKKGYLNNSEKYLIKFGEESDEQGSRPDVSPRDRELQRRANLGSAYRPDEEDLDFGARDRD